MSLLVAYYFAAFAIIVTHKTILPVKGQLTGQSCENGDSSNGIEAELIVDAIRQQNIQLLQSIQELLAESNQERQRQQDSCLEAVDRRSQEQIRDHGVSFQEMKDQLLDNVTASLQVVDRRSQEQSKAQHDIVLKRLETIDRRLNDNDICFNNQTQNSSKFEIGQQNVFDFGEGPVLLPIVDNWIVFLNRSDGSLDFNRDWSEYKNGFGDIGGGEFWLGNEKIHRLTNRIGANYTLRIEVQVPATGQWFYAEYATFSLDSERNKYALRLSRYSGNAGDALASTSLSVTERHNGRSFSTWDADNDRSAHHCAQQYRGGWWFDACFTSCLTCPYQDLFRWHYVGGWQTSGLLRAARMMIKSI